VIFTALYELTHFGAACCTPITQEGLPATEETKTSVTQIYFLLKINPSGSRIPLLQRISCKRDTLGYVRCFMLYAAQHCTRHQTLNRRWNPHNR